jgi:predicted TPR repeat methyltransferase
VRGLFDAYADRFDDALLNGLHYRAPARLAAMIDALHPKQQASRGLDLGCGTGLMAEYLRGRAARFDGVDLSPEMIAKARARGLYDELVVADVVDHLRANDEPFDLLVAADVFVYLGDLAPVLAAAAARLSPDGRFYFTVEAGDGDGFSLRDSLRYAHAPGYVGAQASAAGLAIVAMEEAVLRFDRGEPVHGLVVAARPGPRPEVAADSVGGEAA